jgi:hypothetical protein
VWRAGTGRSGWKVADPGKLLCPFMLARIRLPPSKARSHTATNASLVAPPVRRLRPSWRAAHARLLWGQGARWGTLRGVFG